MPHLGHKAVLPLSTHFTIASGVNMEQQ
jgi:hypothetical protein